MEESADEPATYNVVNGDNSSWQAEEPSWSTAGNTQASQMPLRAVEEAVQPWLVILLAGGSCESKSLVLQVGGCLLGQSPDSRMKEISEKT